MQNHRCGLVEHAQTKTADGHAKIGVLEVSRMIARVESPRPFPDVGAHEETGRRAVIHLAEV
jgi:hypothetical protein